MSNFKRTKIPKVVFSQEMREYIAMRTRADENGCWIWLGAITHGYGVLGHNSYGNRSLAHRASYVAHKGAVPAGLCLDHLCRVRACCNPDHMEPVSHRINCIRGTSPSAVNAHKTACIYGHPLSGDNLRILKTGVRQCITCGRRRNKEQSIREAARASL
jgi:hypothetical protein